MRRRVVTTAASALAVVAGYLALDVAGTVPGLLTTDPVPQPYPGIEAAPGVTQAAAPVSGAVAALAETAPTPDPQALTPALTAILADGRLGERVGMVVQDASTGTVLFESAPTAAREPASVLKVLTAAAALSRLGPATTIDTTALLSGDSTVVLRSGGDLLMSAGEGGPAANGRAGLGDLASQTATALKERSLGAVTVVLDDSVFGGIGWGGAALGPGVTESDVAAGFVAPMSGLAVNAGRLEQKNYAPRTADPGIAAAQTFSDALVANGIAVATPPTRAKAPQDADLLATVSSAPVEEVVQYVLTSSDNNVAEALARLVAVDAGSPPSYAGAGAAVLAQVRTLGIEVGDAALADGSGLSDGSRVSPSVLSAVLTEAASDRHPELRAVLAGLPVAGLTGTLTERFAEPTAAQAARGIVRAKTGSLMGTSALAGTVVDVDGRLLVFAVISDSVPETGPGRVAIDQLSAVLAACGCR